MLVETLNEHGKYLMLPENARSPVDIIPKEIQHQLWLQGCFFNNLFGIDHNLTSGSDGIVYVKEFIDSLKTFKESVEYLDLTLEKLLKMVTFPPGGEENFIKTMLDELGISSEKDRLHDCL